jgi:hypothetical protein
MEQMVDLRVIQVPRRHSRTNQQAECTRRQGKVGAAV